MTTLSRLDSSPAGALPTDRERSFLEALSGWRRYAGIGETLFGSDWNRIETARRRVSLGPADTTIALCSWENPFAKSGGVVQVVPKLAMAFAEHGYCVRIFSPLHRRLKSAPATSKLRPVGEVDGLELWEYPVNDSASGSEGTRSPRWILLGSNQFFLADGGLGPDGKVAGKDPYFYSSESADQRNGDKSLLLRDALAASRAIPAVLNHLGLTENVVVNPHDWQFAPVVLAVKEALRTGLLTSAVTVITSHNPFDHWLPLELLRSISSDNGLVDDAKWQQLPRTAYGLMLPLADGPLVTVSDEFAEELMGHPLQTGLFAPHLQAIFKECGRPVAAPNGNFSSATEAFSASATDKALRGDVDDILAEKLTKRRAALEAISRLQSPGSPQSGALLGHLEGPGGGPIKTLPDDVPLFMGFGRFDKNQKGFDTIVQTVQSLPRGATKWILTPVFTSLDDLPFLEDMSNVARTSCKGDLLVVPFRMDSGYVELQAGVTFIVLASNYEPFGGISEAYQAGTPVIARATGGLQGQVTDLDTGGEFDGTGFLYREMPSRQGVDLEWQAFMQATRPEVRDMLPIFHRLSTALTVAVMRAATTFSFRRKEYGQILARLGAKAAMHSWASAVGRYEAVYRHASR